MSPYAKHTTQDASNPCSNGKCGAALMKEVKKLGYVLILLLMDNVAAAEKYRFDHSELDVLILVLMDNLAAIPDDPTPVIPSGLNPCSNG